MFQKTIFIDYFLKAQKTLAKKEMTKQQDLTKTCLALLALATLLGVGWPVGFLISVAKI